jgi:hypothetical protein
MTERYYRPKERLVVEQWLEDNDGVTGVFKFGGSVCYYNINVDTFVWLRTLCLLDKVWFTRQKENEYIGHVRCNNREQLWYIHDDLMEEV